MGSESVVGKDPAKVRLACREGNSFAPPPPPPGAPKQQDILTKQQNSFSILHLNYSPFPSAVSARTYNRQLTRGAPGTPGTHPRLRHPTLGRPLLGPAPRCGGCMGRRQCAQRQDEQRAEQRGAVRSHGDGEDPGCGRSPLVAPTFK